MERRVKKKDYATYFVFILASLANAVAKSESA